MKRFIPLALFLFAVAVPFQRVQADTSAPQDFGPLVSLVGEWQGKDPEGKPMTASYQWTGGGTSLVDRVTLAFAARHGIGRAFAYDADLVGAGLAPVTTGS